MTAPDPTPYLLPTDLVTAADVLAWQTDCVLAWVPEHPGGRMPAGSLVQLLDERLARERRQACRRGCFAMFREACRERAMERRPPVHQPRYGGWSLASSAYREHRLHYLTRALAFRAAARLQ